MSDTTENIRPQGRSDASEGQCALAPALREVPRIRVAVIGGGASGLMAAYAAATDGHEVVLFEKNEKLGKKLYITGKGRGNLTNDCPPEDFLKHVVHGGKFLRGALYAFPPRRTMEFFEEHGLPLKVERGNRVFPASDHASDITKTLEKACKRAGVTVKLGEQVTKLDVLHSTMRGIITQKSSYFFDAVILATGGLSYPSTGSTGDGLRFAAELGHALTPCAPSLVGIELRGDFAPVSGVSVKNAVLTARRGGKVLFSELGELLFTHYGVSGPLVLSLSALICRLPLAEISLELDFKPALDEHKLDARLLSDLAERKNERMKNAVRGLLPASLGLFVLKAAGIDPEKQANSLTKEERGRLLAALKGLKLQPVRLRGYDEAVVTSGGISTEEVDPKTMESKRIRKLFFCGETLDVDAFTGGFNLQIAFSTGYAAGKGVWRAFGAA